MQSGQSLCLCIRSYQHVPNETWSDYVNADLKLRWRLSFLTLQLKYRHTQDMPQSTGLPRYRIMVDGRSELSKAAPMLQFFFICSPAVSCKAFVLSVFFPHLCFFWCQGRTAIVIVIVTFPGYRLRFLNFQSVSEGWRMTINFCGHVLFVVFLYSGLGSLLNNLLR